MGTPHQAPATPQRIQQMAWGYGPPLIIEAALRNGVFDALDGGTKSVEEVAAITGASPRGLRIVMNALAGLELLSKDASGRYSLTSESEAFLVSSRPSYLGGLIRHTSTQLVPKWLQLNDILRNGRPARSVNDEGEGATFFHAFVEDIFPMSYPSAQALADTLDIASAPGPVRVLDLAAGSGVWSIALAQRSPHVTVTAVDWPGVLDVTLKVASRFGLEERYTFVPGDLDSADFGHGHNIATLGHILHSEGEAASRALLKKTYEALAPGGTIAIAEFLVEEGRNGPPVALIFAVNMLVNTDEGDTFSFPEIQGWLEEAGFVDVRTVPAPGPSPLILANKPKA